MAKFKIRLNTAKETALFVNVCMHYDCGIDCRAHDSNIIFDANAALDCMVNLIGKDAEVDFNCDDQRVVYLFEEEIQLWIVE